MNFPLEHPLLSLKRYKTVTLMATNLKESLFLRFLFCSFFFFLSPIHARWIFSWNQCHHRKDKFGPLYTKKCCACKSKTSRNKVRNQLNVCELKLSSANLNSANSFQQNPTTDGVSWSGREGFYYCWLQLRECTMRFFKLVKCVWAANISKSLLSALATTTQNVIKLIIFFIA